jgi:cation transport ATPase
VGPVDDEIRAVIVVADTVKDTAAEAISRSGSTW